MRRLLVTGFAVLAVLVPAVLVAFTVGTSALDSGRARSNQDSDRDGRFDLKCRDGDYVERVELSGANWGTYPALEQVMLHCDPYIDNPSFGQIGGTAPVHNIEECRNGSHPALTGLKVAHDRYIKDFQLRCGDVTGSGNQVRIENYGFSGEWMLGLVQNNNTKTNLTCGANQVMTGLRLRYKADRDETAVTSVQLFCATVRS